MRTTKLAYVINEICKKVNPGKKAMQKIVYLVQENGLNLGYQYRIHHYGPYCPLLEDDIQRIEMDGFVVREQVGRSSIIRPSSHIELYIDDLEDKDFSEKDREVLNYVIENFAAKTPMELELLSTVLFLVKDIKGKKGKVLVTELIKTVEEIKGDKFEESEIEEAIEELVHHSYLKKGNN